VFSAGAAVRPGHRGRVAVSGETDRDAFVQATEGWEYVPAPVSDPQGALAMALEIRMWPTTIVVDNAGKIVYRASTWGRRAPQALRRALREALKAAGS
jgi:hypothetical protein